MAPNSAAIPGKHSTRPIGDAGRGRHTGKVGWLGGRHRDNSGCAFTALNASLTAILLALLTLLTACGDNDSYAQQKCAEVHADYLKKINVTTSITEYRCWKDGKVIRIIRCAQRCGIK